MQAKRMKKNIKPGQHINLTPKRLPCVKGMIPKSQAHIRRKNLEPDLPAGRYQGDVDVMAAGIRYWLGPE
jgi:hypothetical protein